MGEFLFVDGEEFFGFLDSEQKFVHIGMLFHIIGVVEVIEPDLGYLELRLEDVFQLLADRTQFFDQFRSHLSLVLNIPRLLFPQSGYFHKESVDLSQEVFSSLAERLQVLLQSQELLL